MQANFEDRDTFITDMAAEAMYLQGIHEKTSETFAIYQAIADQFHILARELDEIMWEIDADNQTDSTGGS